MIVVPASAAAPLVGDGAVSNPLLTTPAAGVAWSTLSWAFPQVTCAVNARPMTGFTALWYPHDRYAIASVR